MKGSYTLSPKKSISLENFRESSIAKKRLAVQQLAWMHIILKSFEVSGSPPLSIPRSSKLRIVRATKTIKTMQVCAKTWSRR